MSFLGVVYFILPILVAIAVVLFLVGGALYLFSEDEKSKEDMGEYLMSSSVFIALIVLMVIFISK